MKQTENTIRRILNARFEDVEILSVNITPGEDADGDRVLFIKVVFDGNKKMLDARETSGLARRILPKIAGESGFPIFSFIAKSELGKLKPESV